MFLVVVLVVFQVYTGTVKSLPVGFYSRQLKDAETRYPATEIECLAVVEAVRHFEVYLHGRPFQMETDHKALESLLSSKMLNRRLTRLSTFLTGISHDDRLPARDKER